MTKQSFNSQILNTLKSYFNAFYPLVYIYSFEEDRAEYYLEEICKQINLNLYTWDLINGFMKTEDGKSKKVPKIDTDYADYLNCLSFIEEAEQESVFLLKDFHPAFNLQSSDIIVRKIRNVIVSIRDAKKIIAFLIPPNCEKTSMPKELAKEVVTYRFPLPNINEGKYVLNTVIRESLGRDPNKVDEGDKEKIVKAALGLTSNEMENAFIKAILMHDKVSLDNIKPILEEKKQIIEKSGVLEYFSTDVELTEVGGLDELKKWLDDNKDMFDEKAADVGCDPPKGILLVGVPGCGKSLTAKALASQWKMPLLRFDLSAVFGGLVGESESNMRRALEAAESIAPCVLWIDEIEKGISGMTSSTSGDSGTSQRVFGTLISWMQDRQSPVFFVATANDISRISDAAPELLRSGRFDEIFFIDLPNQEEREQIIRIHLQKRKADPSRFKIPDLVKKTQGFSGSDIEQAVKDARRNSYVAGIELKQTQLEEAIALRLPTAVTMKEKIEFLRKWAEIRARLASKKENVEPIETLPDYVKKRSGRKVIR